MWRMSFLPRELKRRALDEALAGDLTALFKYSLFRAAGGSISNKIVYTMDYREDQTVADRSLQVYKRLMPYWAAINHNLD